MPLFDDSFEQEDEQNRKHHYVSTYVYSLADCFRRNIPVISIEFNPPPVPELQKQDFEYWQELKDPDEVDQKILKSLGNKLKMMKNCRQIGSFLSVTDSAAGILRMHNLDMMRLLGDATFTEKWFDSPPIVWEPRRTILHLTRNHTISWLRHYLERCAALGFNQLLLITGDPLKEVRFKPILSEQALELNKTEEDNFRLKNSIEMLRFVRAVRPDFYIGACHNPFMKKVVAEKHFLKKLEAGSEFFISQPVSYYDECWQAMADFETFRKENDIHAPMILGVFNYAVPVGKKGYKEETFMKRYKFWKKLFGFVPEGVRADYDSGLNGTEILARSINKLKRMGHYHFDVMNAEKNGWSVLKSGQRLAHESDRLTGQFDN